MSGRGEKDFIALLLGFLIVFSTIAFVVTNPRPSDQYYRFYVLGMNGTASDYFSGAPLVSVGHGANWTVGVTDETGSPRLVEVVIKLGNFTTAAPNDTLNKPSDGQVAAAFLHVLLSNQTWQFPLDWRVVSAVSHGSSSSFTISVGGSSLNASVLAAGGSNLRLIMELWTYDPDTGGLVYGWQNAGQASSAWLQVWFNCTSSH